MIIQERPRPALPRRSTTSGDAIEEPVSLAVDDRDVNLLQTLLRTRSGVCEVDRDLHDVDATFRFLSHRSSEPHHPGVIALDTRLVEDGLLAIILRMVGVGRL